MVIERPDGCQNVQRFAESQGFKVTVDEKDGLFFLRGRLLRFREEN